MTAETGAAFLLKIGDGNTPPNFTTVAGLRTTQMSIKGQTVDITNKDSGGWRALLTGAGVRSVSIAAAGIFMGSAQEARVQSNALSGSLDMYQLVFQSGHTVTGQFLVAKLDTSGDYQNERSYTMALESSGAVVTA
jgi:TP901-1 family phage major tail protein